MATYRFFHLHSLVVRKFRSVIILFGLISTLSIRICLRITVRIVTRCSMLSILLDVLPATETDLILGTIHRTRLNLLMLIIGSLRCAVAIFVLNSPSSIAIILVSIGVCVFFVTLLLALILNGARMLTFSYSFSELVT